jgi:hypothetical protein
MKIYPYSSPIILTDTIFNLYGGQLDQFSPGQRTAAYLIAETQAASYVGTLLLPTVITGTWGYSPNIVTDYGYVSQIFSVNFLTIDSPTATVLTSNSGYAFIFNDTYGYVDVFGLLGYCGCAGGGIPYQVQVAYQAGLPTGVATQPAFLLALTMAAQLSLNEMIFPSQNESTGDIGIESYSSLDYSEKRVKARRTVFGTSAKAEKIANLLDGVVRKARPALVL